MNHSQTPTLPVPVKIFSKEIGFSLSRGALTTYPSKLNPQNFCSRPGGTHAPSALPGYACVPQWIECGSLLCCIHGRRSRGEGEDKSPPPEFGAGGLSPQILSWLKILSTSLLALQCRKMCFLPLQQEFYSKSGHASPQNSSQIYAYGCILWYYSDTAGGC